MWYGGQLAQIMPTSHIFKPLLGAFPKIGDWIRKYVQIQHGF